VIRWTAGYLVLIAGAAAGALLCDRGLIWQGIGVNAVLLAAGLAVLPPRPPGTPWWHL
jgi:hypothetical protein